MLDERRAKVLQALVEEYIRSGEPVSSAAVLDRSGLQVSSATIRNDLGRLETEGYVHQPHTSAGRVPTDKGYRYYVDHCSPARLRTATRARIESFFASMHRELSRLLKDTSSLLSDLTHYPAVVLGPGLGSERIVGIHLVPISSKVLMAVTVAEGGRVSQELIRLEHEPSAKDVEAAEDALERLYCGRSLESGLAALEQLPASDLPSSVREVAKAVADGLKRIELGTRDVYLGGTSQLASLWQDLAHVHQVLSLLEREQTLLEMLEDDTLGTTVRIGDELNLRDADLAVVSTTYEAGEQGRGTIGVLGPMRMNYRRTIKVVEEVGEGLADSLGS